MPENPKIITKKYVQILGEKFWGAELASQNPRGRIPGFQMDPTLGFLSGTDPPDCLWDPSEAVEWESATT